MSSDNVIDSAEQFIEVFCDYAQTMGFNKHIKSMFNSESICIQAWKLGFTPEEVFDELFCDLIIKDDT